MQEFLFFHVANLTKNETTLDLSKRDLQGQKQNPFILIHTYQMDQCQKKKRKKKTTCKITFSLNHRSHLSQVKKQTWPPTLVQILGDSFACTGQNSQAIFIQAKLGLIASWGGFTGWECLFVKVWNNYMNLPPSSSEYWMCEKNQF